MAGNGRPGDVERPVLRVLNWSWYIDRDPASGPDESLARRSPVLRAFMKKTGCEVLYEEYDTEVEMSKKIHNLPGFYDVVITTGTKAAELGRAGLTVRLDEAEIPNLAGVAPKFRDPDGFYAPYLAGTTGIVYRRELVGGDVTSWDQYFHPPERLKGKIGALESSFMLSFGLIALGLDPNTTDAASIRKSAGLFVRLKREGFLSLFSSDAERVGRALTDGTLAMTVLYSGDALSLVKGCSDIRYAIPREGGEYYVDGMVLLKTAPNRNLAARFINYILAPQVNAILAANLNYISPVTGAAPYIRKLSPHHADNPAISIPPEAMDRLFVFKDANALETRRLWRKIIK